MRFAPLVIALLFACAPAPKTATLQAGTRVDLILLQQLSAGGSEEGEEVAYMVTEDVLSADGIVAIPRGAIAYGRVNWSRSAGALSKITNEPPRLAVTIDRTTSVDNRTVMLHANENDEPFHFSGKNTSPSKASATIEQALEDEQTRQAIERLFAAFEGQSMGDERVIAEIADQLSLDSTKKMASEHSIRDIEGILRQVVDGHAKRIVGGETTLLIDTIAEIAGLRFRVGDRIAGIFRGPTIHAYPGTPVVAYVAEPITIEVD